MQDGNRENSTEVNLSVDLTLTNYEGGMMLDGDLSAGDLEKQPVVVAALCLTHIMKLAQRELEYIFTQTGMTEEEIIVVTAYAQTPLEDSPNDSVGEPGLDPALKETDDS